MSGKGNTDGIMTFDELENIGKESNNDLLLFNVFCGRLFIHHWNRDHQSLLELCEKHPHAKAKRIINCMRYFYEGIAALNLARQRPNESKYKIIGETAVKELAKFEQINKWLFENKSLLLQAELHYLNQDYEAAENAYLASIQSAKNHRFIHEQATANELYGIYCIESRMVVGKGSYHLGVAVDPMANELYEIYCSERQTEDDGEWDSFLSRTKLVRQDQNDHGIFNTEECNQNNKFSPSESLHDRGVHHLRIALDQYKQWGAMNKAAGLQRYIDKVTTGIPSSNGVIFEPIDSVTAQDTTHKRRLM